MISKKDINETLLELAETKNKISEIESSLRDFQIDEKISNREIFNKVLELTSDNKMNDWMKEIHSLVLALSDNFVTQQKYNKQVFIDKINESLEINLTLITNIERLLTSIKHNIDIKENKSTLQTFLPEKGSLMYYVFFITLSFFSLTFLGFMVDFVSPETIQFLKDILPFISTRG